MSCIQVEKTSEIKTVLCMHEGVWSSVHVMLRSGSRKKKNGVGMALDVATFPLILYRKVYSGGIFVNVLKAP